MGEQKKTKRALLKVEITWSKRVAKVTSLTDDHVLHATCLDLGDNMEVEISSEIRSGPCPTCGINARLNDGRIRAYAGEVNILLDRLESARERGPRRPAARGK